jgi:hypothetical protein
LLWRLRRGRCWGLQLESFGKRNLSQYLSS